MVRGKLELIENEKSRRDTFRKRKNGILKKAFELNTLCGVEVGVIVYRNSKPNFQRGRQETYPEETETYPKNPKEVSDIFLKSCKLGSDEKLTDFYRERIKKINDKTKNLREKIDQTQKKKLNDMSLDQLLVLLKNLEHKIEILEKRRKVVMRSKQIAVCDEGHQLPQKAMSSNNVQRGRSMLYKGALPHFPEEQNNVVASNYLIGYNPLHQHYNNGSIIMMNGNGMSWTTDNNIQNTPSTSKSLNSDDTSRFMMQENRVQCGNYMDESVSIYDGMPIQLGENVRLNVQPYPQNNNVYPMSASYLQNPILASKAIEDISPYGGVIVESSSARSKT